MTTVEHAFQTGSRRRPDKEKVRCCNCQMKVNYTDSWVTVPFGAHGNSLPLPVFLHCYACSYRLDAAQAYRMAYARDKAAGLPDPEKVKREQELNEQLSKMPEVDG